MRVFNETNEIYEIWNLFIELVLLAERGEKCVENKYLRKSVYIIYDVIELLHGNKSGEKKMNK